MLGSLLMLVSARDFLVRDVSERAKGSWLDVPSPTETHNRDGRLEIGSLPVADVWHIARGRVDDFASECDR